MTLTRSFFTIWVGVPKGFLWTRNCVVTFARAIAGFSLDSQLHGSFGLAIAWFPVDSQCWIYIPGCIFLVLYSWLCIPGFQISHFRLLVLYSRLYIPGLGMLWRPRPCFAASAWTTLYSWFYIPGSIFLVLYSWLCIPGFQISHFRFQIQISNFRFRSSDAKYCCFCMRVAENLVNTAVFACFLQKTL